ncbi:MAG: universal stress protein [Bernardetiaceae bacterium]|nr:universal stress protein [Bernardetiaceae bacterium]
MKIKKLLVAIDFSPESARALAYTITFVRTFDAQLILHHTYPSEMTIDLAIPSAHQNGEARHLFISESITYFLKAFLNEQLEALGHSASFLEGTDIVYSVKKGDAFETIQDMVSAEQIDLIMLGTRGKGEEKKLMFGSVTSDLIRKLPTALITVPAHAAVNPIHKIAYASDGTSVNPSTTHLALLGSLASQWGASVSAFHITTKALSATEKAALDKHKAAWLEEATKHIHTHNLAYYVMQDETLTEGIQDFIASDGIDMLIMPREAEGFWAQLFKKSQTLETAKRISIPMLVVSER